MTANYSEFIGKEPSLNELHAFVSNNQELLLMKRKTNSFYQKEKKNLAINNYFRSQ
jgi:hypothetical protein